MIIFFIIKTQNKKEIKNKEELFMMTKTYKLETLTCPSCMAKIEGALKKTKGVKETEVLFNSSKAKVTFDESIVESEDIKLVIERLGYKVLGEK